MVHRHVALRVRVPFEHREVHDPQRPPARLDQAEIGAELEAHYIDLLRELGTRSGMLGKIFTKAQNKIQDPAKLSRLIAMVDEEQWVVMGADVKGDIYEGLLERNAEDTKSGAGQYFTPRPLIQAIVEVIRPQPGETICDPACGTGGFLLAAHQYVADPADRPCGP